MRLSISSGLSISGQQNVTGGISVTINGLTGGSAVVGDHASITMSVSEGTISARKWGSTSGGSEYGTGTSPTDYTAGEGGALYATATVGGEDYTASASIVFAAPVAAGGIADQSYTEDSAISTLDVSSDFTGSGITYALAPSSASLPAGLSLASNGQITGTPTTEAAQVNIVVRGTNSGGFDDTAFGVTITAAVSGDTSITSGSVTFSWTNGRTAGTDESGRAYIVVPTGSETINQPSPAQTTVVADVVGGVMYNPQRTGDSTREHGFDERNPKYNGTLNVTGTQAMSAGDRLIKSVPNTADYDDTRDAFSEEYGILYAVSSAPASGAMLGPAVTYSGHAYPDSYSIDWTALVNRCQNRAVANGMNFPTYAKIIAALNEQMCMYPFNSSDSTSDGYEPLITHDMLGLSQHQYGGDLAEMIDVAFIGLQYNVWSTAEKTAIIKRLVRHGIDMFPIFDANKASAVDGVQARGSHSMFHQGCLILALEACGRSSDIADIFTYEATGCWDQAFKVTNALITSDFSSHTSDTLPQFYRQMTLGAQPGGTTLRLPNSSRIFAINTTAGQVNIPPGTRVMRGGSHVATITAEVDFGVGASGTFDVTIDAQPSPAFATSDVVSLEAPVNTVYDGAYDWQQNGGYVQSGQNKELFSPSAFNNYRSLFRVGNIVGLGAMGLYHPVMDPVRGYFERTRGTEPASNNNYFDAFGDWQGAGTHDISDILYDDDEVKALLYATSDFESADPSALSIYQIDEPSVAVAGTDVLSAQDFTAVSGGVALKVSGVATGGENTWVEIRAIKASDSTVVLDWYPRAQISAGGTWAWSGVIPETTDSRLLFEARSLGTPAVIHQPTEEIGVGYVSDVTAPTLSSPTDAANGATASTASVSTDEGNGTLYWVVTTSATAPSAAQVKLGQDNSSVAATDSGSQSVSGTGVQTISPAPSGLTASTSYTTHFMHEDAVGNQSTVSSASGFTTAAAWSANGISNAGTRYMRIDNTYSTGGIGQQGTLSGWLYDVGAAGNPLNGYMSSDGTQVMRWCTGASGNFLFELKTAANSVLLYFLSQNSVLTGSAWNHVLVSWDLSGTPKVDVAVNDTVLSTFADGPTLTAGTPGDFDRVSVFNAYTGSFFYTGDMAEIFMDKTYRDLSVAANRRNFIDASGSPVDLSSLGTPHLLLTNDAATFTTNEGTGGNFTEAGTGSFSDVTGPT